MKFTNKIVKGPTPGATRQIRIPNTGGSEGGSCLLKSDGTRQSIVIQDVHCFYCESLVEGVNLGFIH